MLVLVRLIEELIVDEGIENAIVEPGVMTIVDDADADDDDDADDRELDSAIDVGD